jgi:hypothetical protein
LTGVDGCTATQHNTHKQRCNVAVDDVAMMRTMRRLLCVRDPLRSAEIRLKLFQDPPKSVLTHK